MVVAIALAGALGAVTRFVVDGYVQERHGYRFPWGTFLINASGSLLLGVLVGLALSERLSPWVFAVLATGFCGAYTTFSTWGYETMRLAEGGSRDVAAGYAVGSLAAGLAAAAAGLALGSWL